MTIALAASTGGGGGGGGGTGDPVGTAAAVIATHEAATDPHASRSSQPSRDQAGDYTPSASDVGWRLRAPDAVLRNWTINAGVFDVDNLFYIDTTGNGGVQLVEGAGMTIDGSSLQVVPSGLAVMVFDGPANAVVRGGPLI